MQNEVILAGFGGQGIMLIGKMLAYTGMKQGREVSWFPAYGPEMRGGTANCTVVISERPVGSPVIQSPRAVVAMNLPSLDKFEPKLKPGGLLLINSSLINRDARRDDISVLKVPANQIANELKNPRAANMVALGAYVGVSEAVDMEELEKVVKEIFASKPKVIDSNVAALRKGFELGQSIREKERVAGGV
jgi:2-oxoglutarate ferredoxin oxidoreductase subunit gamma